LKKSISLKYQQAVFLNHRPQITRPGFGEERKEMNQPENQIEQTEEQFESNAPVYEAPHLQPQDVPAEPARMGAGARLIGAIMSPGETFADVNRKADWIVPLIILVLLTVGTTFFVTWRLKPDAEKITREAIRKQVERRGGQMPPEEQIQQQISFQKKLAPFIPLVAAVGVGVWTVILSGIYALGMLLLQAKTTFKKIFSVVLWSSVAIGIIYNIVFIASLMVKDEEGLRGVDIQNPTASIPTNVGAFLDSTTSPVLRALAGSIDIFSVWNIVLLSIGFAAIAGSKKIKPGKAATMVLGVWVIGILIKAAFASFFG
jgi:hypothetical protein